MRSPALTLISVTLLLLGACTDAETPEPKRKPKRSPTPTAAPANPEPPVVAEPPSEAAPAPTPPPTNEWWCVCYRSDTDAGPTPATACRQRQSECRALESRIKKGGRGLVAGSITHACRQVIGEHPGDALGGRDPWQPSQLAGAWTSEGACQLDAALANQDDDSFDVLMNEALGRLRIGMTAGEVLDDLGSTTEKGNIEQSQATGNFEQAWVYPDIGLTLYMSADSRTGPQTLGSLRATAGCKLETRRGVAIGSDRRKVEKAYGNVHEKDGLEPADNSVFIAGSVYGGVFFMFEGDTVSEIFMGAGAE